MILSIITPCTRPENLPIIYSSILQLGENVEWLIIYDSDKIDNRILRYSGKVPIRLFAKKSEKTSTASEQRNIGIKHAKGEYLYFLDDDNLIHPKLIDGIKKHLEPGKILAFNQVTTNRKRKLKLQPLEKNLMFVLDTAQIVVPRFLESMWDENAGYIDERNYLRSLINEVGFKGFKYIDKLYSYRNYLRRFESHG